MAFFELDDVFTYQDANDIKKLWAGDTAPTDPGTGEVWLDTSSTPIQLKRWNGSGWDIVGEAISPFEITTTGISAQFLAKQTDGATAIVCAGELYAFFGSQTDNDIRFIVNDSSKMVVRSNGYVGIGTNFPAYPIHLFTTDENALLVLEHENGANVKIGALSDRGQMGTRSPHPLNIVTSNISRISIDVNGNVNIAENLEVLGNLVSDGSTVWHAGNDGSGSGLDADKLDGQEGSYYRNAGNLNAGTVARARLSDLWYDNDYNENQNMFIQTGSKYCAVAGTNVFFDQAFSEIPRVVGISATKGRGVAIITNRTTTSFKGWMSEIGGAIDWIAIGRKD